MVGPFHIETVLLSAFSEQLVIGTPLEGCLWRQTEKDIKNTIIIFLYQKLNSSEAATDFTKKALL